MARRPRNSAPREAAEGSGDDAIAIDRGMLVNLLVAAGSIVLTLAIIEGYLQLTWHAGPQQPFEFSQELGWENRKGFTQTFWNKDYGGDITQVHNSIGIRDAREFGEKTKPRIVIIGDSFVYGTGLDQGDMIGRRLQETLPEYDVIAAGTVGYSTTQYLQYYVQRAKSLDPDIVVFAVFVNDFAENSYGTIFGYTKPWILSLNAQGQLEQQFNQQFARGIPPVDARPSLLLPQAVKSGIAGLRKEKELYENSPHRMNQAWFMFEDPLTPQAQYAAALEANVLAFSHQKIKNEDNVTFVVMYIPHQLQTDEAYRERIFDEMYSDHMRFRFNWFTINLIMTQFANEIKYPYLDLTGAIAGDADTARLYLSDGHLSPEGTALADAELHAFLVREGLVS